MSVTGNLQNIKVELGIGSVVIFLESDIKLTSFDRSSICYAEIPLTLAEQRSVFEVLTNMVDLSDEPVPFIPTPENVNALPEGIRGYIHLLETRCDPAGEMRAWKAGEDAVFALANENVGLKDTIKALQSGLDEGMEAFDKFREEHNETNKDLNRQVVKMEHKVEELYAKLNEYTERITELEAKLQVCYDDVNEKADLIVDLRAELTGWEEEAY